MNEQAGESDAAGISLRLRGVRVRGILEDIHLAWPNGVLTGLIGPNGAGKSTLLRVAAGVLAPDAGGVELTGRPLVGLSARERARDMAYLPQQLPDDIAFTVREFIEMGRYPHRGRLATGTPVDDAIDRLALRPFAEASMHSLSGGERQRTAIARCLAQESRVLLLDEPTASLDLFYQMEILELLRKLADAGYLVVLAIHQLELAMRYCTHFVLLQEGRVYASGDADDVINAQSLSDVFHISARTYEDPYLGALRLSYTRQDG